MKLVPPMIEATVEAVAPADDVALIMAVDAPTPGLVLVSGARVIGRGWALAGTSIAEVSISIGDRLLCYATYGAYRPDLAEGFPQYPNADHAGFTFSAPVDLPPCDEALLVVEVRTTAGERASCEIPVVIAAEAAATGSQPALPPMQLRVDGAEWLPGDTLSVSGWVVSLEPLEEIRIFVGADLVGVARHGIPRPDIGRDLPEYPNAPVSGFVYSGPGPGERAHGKPLRIRAVAHGGLSREALQPVSIAAEPRFADEEAAGEPSETAAGNGAPARGESEPATASAAVDQADIRFHCDHVFLTREGKIDLGGWAFSPSVVDDISVLFDGAELGRAERNLPRPDVGRVFDSFPHAMQSGFAFSRLLGSPLDGEHRITIRVSTGSGAARHYDLTVTAASPAEQAAATGFAGAEQEPIKLAIDAPVIANGAAVLPVYGSLQIEGWALSVADMATVDIFIDGVLLGPAYLGIRRQDVAEAYVGWRHAALSGFGISIPEKALKPGERLIRARATDVDGRLKEFEFTVTVEAASTGGLLRERLPGAEILQKRRVLAALDPLPVFALTLLMDGGKGALDHVESTLRSLERQEYEHWRLTILCRDRRGRDRVSSFLAERFASLADRATIIIWNGKWPISAETADRPTLVGLLRSGDRLGCDALLEIAIAFGRDPATDFIYSDECRLNAASDAIEAWVKPDWSPNLLLSTNYIGRFWVVRAELAARIADPDRPFRQHGEYDLLLRLTAAAGRVVHLGKMLCQRSPVTIDDPAAEMAALGDAMRSRHEKAEVLPGRTIGTYRVKRSVARPGLVSIIIPTCASRGLVRTCIESLRARTRYRNFEIVCIENIPVSDPKSRRWLKSNADRVLRSDEPFNWSRFNNLAAASCRDADYLLFLNDDIEIIEPDWLDAMLEHAQRDEVGAVGPLLLYPDRRIQHAGMFMAELGRARHAFRFDREEDLEQPFGQALAQRDVISVTGACLLVRRDRFDALGGFDDAHGVINNDLDFCLRCHENGLQVVFTPFARLIHHEMASRGAIGDDYDVDAFRGAWAARFRAGDPFYSPLLSRKTNNYTVDPEPAEIVLGARPLLLAERVRSILAVKLDHIGDFMTSLPALRRLKQRFPEAQLCVLAGKASASLAALEPAIDELIEFNFFHMRSGLGQTDLSDADYAALAERLAPYRFDIAIDLRKHPDTRKVLRYAGAVVTAGYDHGGRFPWLDVALEWEGDAPLVAKREHIVEDLLRMVDAVAESCTAEPSTIDGRVAREMRAAEPPPALQALFADKPVVCVHPASGNALRQWPAGHFARLIDLILDTFDVTVAVIGGNEERDVIDAVMGDVVDRASVVPLIGAVPLAELPQFLARCALFVGNNSGPKHIAAGLGVPTIGVHSGVIDSREWAPVGPMAIAVRRDMLCSPCYFAKPEQCRRGLACLTELTPADVLRAGSDLFATLDSVRKPILPATPVAALTAQ